MADGAEDDVSPEKCGAQRERCHANGLFRTGRVKNKGQPPADWTSGVPAADPA
ncbi:hypothetical protein Pa4123_43280 [Phytohabitans aurantiacus]|uniref:Uncharacterized protein n=1 Tax=Phytohabitans aurantiacus TaxID=3016789 RepID=A0ABQ5QWX3_9ACTN|nr:hypothetical protein Pa4123_43280 [Phytohabitans aurantiacus]